MSDIFISYAGEDLERAGRLAEALQSQGWSVFWDRTIPPGETWRGFIGTELAQAHCVLVAWSEASVDSHWVMEEADDARGRRILVPVLFDEVRPPLGFRHIQAANLVNWTGSPNAPGYRLLIGAIERLVDKPETRKATETPLPTESTAEDRAAKAESAEASRSTMPKASAIVGSPSQQTAAAPQRGPSTVFRDTLAEGSKGPEMVRIPGGGFEMGDLQGEGDSDERPVRTVSIRPFAIGRDEVTFEEYERFSEATGHEKPADAGWGRGRRPVINVSWEDAVAYAEWLSAQTGKRYRLPSEAEWEYAARAGTTTSYWWGDEVGENWANCAGCGSQWDGKQTAPVGSFEPNPFGLTDTAGNVWEWVQDCWHDSYEGAPTDGSAWEEEGSQRVIRGGSWINEPWNVRSATRDLYFPVTRGSYVGFRLAQDIK